MDPIPLVSVELVVEQLDLRAPVRAFQKQYIRFRDSDSVILQPRVEVAYLLVTRAKQQFQSSVRCLHTTKQPVVQANLARQSTRGVRQRRPEPGQMREIRGPGTWLASTSGISPSSHARVKNLNRLLP